MHQSDEELHQAIGRKVKTFRLHNRLTIEQLGQRADVSKSMLSMVEAGQRAPSIRLLRRVAKSLNVPVGELLEEPEQPESAIIVRRQQQQKEVISPELASGLVYHLAEMNWSNLFIRFYEYQLDDIPASPAIFQHAGFWIVSVLDGIIDCDVNGEIHRLTVGDTICCDAAVPHSMVKVVTGPVKMIGLQERPRFRTIAH